MKFKSHKLAGTTYIIASASFYATYGIWSKLMAGTFGEFNQAWIRGLILLAVLVPFGLFTRGFRRIRRRDWIWFIATALPGGLNQAPYFYGFKHLPVGTATLLFYLMLTLGTYVFGWLFFHERLTWTKYAAFALATVGLGVIYHFSLTPDQLLSALATCAAGLMGSCFVVLSKKLSSYYSEIQILSGDFIVMVSGNLAISLFLGEALPQATLVPWLAQLAYTATLLIANTLVIAGFRYLEPSVAGLIGLLEVIFAALFGIIIFGEVLTPSLIVGSAIILTAAALPDLTALPFKGLSFKG